jgi:predicted aldo/keto reductase-like oxidoreductase
MIAGLSRDFPQLKRSTKPKSPATPVYNCIAWALGHVDKCWWPHQDACWPLTCPEEVTIPAFQAVFKIFGYEPCKDGQLENDYEKIALYAKENKPTHAARQLGNGRWTSKCGQNVDIEHDLRELEGKTYGQVIMFFRRPRSIS